ncbi:MAG: TPM domain-containing protein [Deltaproteobacteria bacterium]|nr:TPM domain-containing protein [Deltaproteobacteria bacterium]
MKLKSLFLVLLVAIGLNIFPLYSLGSDNFPRPVGAINDFAGVIPEKYKQTIENVAREVLDKTGIAVVVATLKDIDGNDPADYANRLYEAWGIGKKGEDRGVLILLALKERRVRIEVGYGFEGTLTDGMSGEILDKYVVPLLKKGDYGGGIFNAVIAVSSIAAKDAGVSLTAIPGNQVKQRETPKINLFSLIIFFIILSLLLGTRQGRRILPLIIIMLLMGGRGGGSSSGFGGFGGGFGGFGGGMSGGGGAGRGF